MKVIKNILSRVINKNSKKLIRYPYNIALDIWEQNPNSRKYLGETRVIDLYNNKISKKQL